MNTFEQEQLLGYLLDALDDSERGSFQRRLIREPDLRGELASVGEQLKPLQAANVHFENRAEYVKQVALFLMAS